MPNTLISNSASCPNMCDLKTWVLVVLVVCCCHIVLQMKTDCSPQNSIPWFTEQTGSQLPLQAPSVMETSYTKKQEKTNKMDQLGPKNLVVESGLKWS